MTRPPQEWPESRDRERTVIPANTGSQAGERAICRDREADFRRADSQHGGDRGTVPRRAVTPPRSRGLGSTPSSPTSCTHPWHEVVLLYLGIAVAMAIVLWPLCWLAVTLYDRAILGCP